MKTNEIFRPVVLFVLFYFILTDANYSQVIYNGLGYIPGIYQTRWTTAGLFPANRNGLTPVTPQQGNNIFVMIPGNCSAQILSAINFAKQNTGTTVIYFPKGTFYFNSTIQLNADASDIVFQGQGPNLTLLEFSVLPEGDCFKIEGNEEVNQFSLNQNIAKGDSLFNITSPFDRNNWVQLCEYYFPHADPGNAGQITQVENRIGSSTLEIKDVATKEYSTSYLLWMKKINPVVNIGFENMKIRRSNESRGHGKTIYYKYAVNCWIKGVEMENATGYHVRADYCAHLKICGSYIHTATFYGSDDNDGFGYGVVLGSSTTNCLIENNIFRELRHAMLIGECANGNVFEYNFSTGQHAFYNQTDIQIRLADLCLHGRSPYSNLFEHNIIEWMSADNSHAKNGGYNAFIRNISYDFINQNWYPITLYDAPETAILACESSGENGSIQGFGITTFSIDYYGYYSGMRNHLFFWRFPYLKPYSTNEDVSYYYSSRPSFLTCSYTWPSIGPKRYSNDPQTTGSIPAKDRYYSGTKTYLPDPMPLPPPLYSSGTLPACGDVWRGTHILTGDVTVPSGACLVVLPGATIKVPYNKKLSVNGVMIADGVSSNKITFTRSSSSYWHGIIFENSSIDNLCVINNCNISYANCGLYFNQSAPAVRYCTLQNNGYGIIGYGYSYPNQFIQHNSFIRNVCAGIYLDNQGVSIEYNDIQGCGGDEEETYGIYCCNVPYNTRLYDNSLSQCGSAGVYLYYSEPVIVKNDVYDNQYGIDCSYYSYPEFRDFDDEPGHNTVAYNSSDGMVIDNTSEPVLGSEGFGYNSFYDNGSYDLNWNQSWQLDATYNYWKTSPPHVRGNINTSYALGTNPNPDPHGMGKALAKAESPFSGAGVMAGNVEV
jgi:parallel beta-helix repeat protein